MYLYDLWWIRRILLPQGLSMKGVKTNRVYSHLTKCDSRQAFFTTGRLVSLDHSYLSCPFAHADHFHILWPKILVRILCSDIIFHSDIHLILKLGVPAVCCLSRMDGGEGCPWQFSGALSKLIQICISLDSNRLIYIWMLATPNNYNLTRNPYSKR